MANSPPPGGSYIGAYTPEPEIDIDNLNLPSGRQIGGGRAYEEHIRFSGSKILAFESEVLASLPPDKASLRTLITAVDEQIRKGGNFDDEPMGTKGVFSMPMKYTEGQIMRFSDDVELFILVLQEMWTANRGPGIREKVEKILRLYHAANGLKTIHRFLDKNQPPLIVDVSADGSNLRRKDVNPTRSKILKAEWKLHRHWIRFLHYPGLFYEPAFTSSNKKKASPKLSPKRIMELYALYKSGRYLQEQETVDTYSGGKENFPLNPSDPNKNDLWWVWPCRQRLHSVLGQVADMGYAKPPVTQAQSQLSAMRGLAGSIAQLNLNPLSREEIVRANLSRNPKLLDEMIDFVHTSMSGPGERYDPFLRLVIDLLDKEDTFESKLAVEHVEDKLINKQVSFFDVDNLAMNISGDPSTYFSWLVNPQGRTAFNDVLENKIYKIIEEASLVNRTRRNFRLLRDWQDRRPWTQIIQLYDDTLPEDQWLSQAVGDYNAHTYLPKRNRLGSRDNTSSLRSISQHLFGFTPLLTSELDDLPLGHPLQDPCKLCSKPFVANSGFNSSIVGLGCTMAHHFHLTCIFTFWDQPGKYLHNCPTCGEAAQLNWDRVGIDYKKTLNFAHNLMGWTVDHNTIANIYEDSAAGRKARAAYDVPPMPPHRDRSIIHPNDVSDGTLLWWMQQNMTSLCALENPISWKPMEFEPGQLARIRNAWIDTPYNSRPFDRVARDLGRRWMNLEFDTGGRIRDPTQNVHGVDRKRMLHGTRYSPSQEAAWVRAQRRRRDRVRREAVRASGSGLVNLPGI